MSTKAFCKYTHNVVKKKGTHINRQLCAAKVRNTHINSTQVRRTYQADFELLWSA